MENNEVYYPPTYVVDGFTHGTSNPDKLLNVANHFYSGGEGDWYCLRMTVESLAATGVKTVFEGTARLVINNQILMAQMMSCFPTSAGASIRMQF